VLYALAIKEKALRLFASSLDEHVPNPAMAFGTMMVQAEDRVVPPIGHHPFHQAMASSDLQPWLCGYNQLPYYGQHDSSVMPQYQKHQQPILIAKFPYSFS
jgi:thioesterase domain-containing protein